LGHFVGFFVVVVLCCFPLFCFSLFPLWWDNDRTTFEMPSPALEAEELTPKLLRLKLYYIRTWRFFFIYLFFIFIFYFQSSVSLMPVQLTVD
jgi:hypothetical protein